MYVLFLMFVENSRVFCFVITGTNIKIFSFPCTKNFKKCTCANENGSEVRNRSFDTGMRDKERGLFSEPVFELLGLGFADDDFLRDGDFERDGKAAVEPQVDVLDC